MAQMYVEPGNKEVNMDHAEKVMKESSTSDNGANQCSTELFNDGSASGGHYEKE
jgi:hypothetical protein